MKQPEKIYASFPSGENEPAIATIERDTGDTEYLKADWVREVIRGEFGEVKRMYASSLLEALGLNKQTF